MPPMASTWMSVGDGYTVLRVACLRLGPASRYTMWSSHCRLLPQPSWVGPGVQTAMVTLGSTSGKSLASLCAFLRGWGWGGDAACDVADAVASSRGRNWFACPGFDAMGKYSRRVARLSVRGCPFCSRSFAGQALAQCLGYLAGWLAVR